MSDITRLKEALQRARDLRKAKRLYGVNAIYKFVSDVDGDWLENWRCNDTSS